MSRRIRPLMLASLVLLLAPARPAGAQPAQHLTDAPDKSEQVAYIIPGVLSKRTGYNVATVITCTNLTPKHPFSPRWEFYKQNGDLFLSFQPYILLAGTTHVVATQAIPSIDSEIDLDINTTETMTARIVTAAKTATHCIAQLYRNYAINGPQIITPLEVIPVARQKFSIK